MQRTVSAFLMVLFMNAVGWVTPTVEARMNLNGTYATTSARSCTVATTPFTNDPSGVPTVIPTSGVLSRQSSVDSGTVTFKADGTGTSTGRSTTMNISSTSGSILGISEFEVPFTYIVNPDNTVGISFDEVTFTVFLGNGAGLMGTASPRSALFQIGNGANVLVSAPQTSIAQETLYFSSAVPPFTPLPLTPFTQYRICTRSSTFVKR